MAQPTRQVSLSIEKANSALTVISGLIAEKIHEDDRKKIDELIERARNALDNAALQLADARQAAEAALDRM